MKVRIEISDELAEQARQSAAEAGTSMRDLLEEALRREVARRQNPGTWEPDPTLAFGSGGLTAAAASLPWGDLRDLAMQR
ncbi:MAG: hypothetical protein ACKOW5_17845 [Actinomycetales bacterium]